MGVVEQVHLHCYKRSAKIGQEKEIRDIIATSVKSYIVRSQNNEGSLCLESLVKCVF